MHLWLHADLVQFTKATAAPQHSKCICTYTCAQSLHPKLLLLLLLLAIAHSASLLLLCLLFLAQLLQCRVHLLLERVGSERVSKCGKLLGSVGLRVCCCSGELRWDEAAQQDSTNNT